MTTSKGRKYRFIEDPGHGWLEVPTAELKQLNIAHLISSCSYQTRDRSMSYLEEDCDLSVFAVAKGWTPKDAYTNWQTTHQENTFIRQLPCYPESPDYSYAASYEYRYGKPYEEPQWLKEQQLGQQSLI